MNLNPLISCIPISTNRFTQKCDCFPNHCDSFLLREDNMIQVKTSGVMLTVD